MHQIKTLYCDLFICLICLPQFLTCWHSTGCLCMGAGTFLSDTASSQQAAMPHLLAAGIDLIGSKVPDHFILLFLHFSFIFPSFFLHFSFIFPSLFLHFSFIFPSFPCLPSWLKRQKTTACPSASCWDHGWLAGKPGWYRQCCASSLVHLHPPPTSALPKTLHSTGIRMETWTRQHYQILAFASIQEHTGPFDPF